MLVGNAKFSSLTLLRRPQAAAWRRAFLVTHAPRRRPCARRQCRSSRRLRSPGGRRRPRGGSFSRRSGLSPKHCAKALCSSTTPKLSSLTPLRRPGFMGKGWRTDGISGGSRTAALRPGGSAVSLLRMNAMSRTFFWTRHRRGGWWPYRGGGLFDSTWGLYADSPCHLIIHSKQRS